MSPSRAPAPQSFERMRGASPVRGERVLVQRAQLLPVRCPLAEFGGDRRVLQHANPVEVLQIVDGVRDVVRGVHNGGLDGLLPRFDPAEERCPCLLKSSSSVA